MKKLIIVFAAIALAVTSNAATVNWGSGTIKLPSGINAKGTVSASLFIVDATTYATYAAFSDATALSDAIYKAYSGKSAQLTATSNNKSIATLSYGNYASGDSVYALVLYTTTENETAYCMGNYGTAKFEAAQDKSVGQLANYLGGNASAGATAWSSNVPEPTSGLLMLLGFCGLALRRRHA